MQGQAGGRPEDGRLAREEWGKCLELSGDAVGACPLWGEMGRVRSGSSGAETPPPPPPALAPRAGACPAAGRGLEGAGRGGAHDCVPTEEDSRKLGLQVEVVAGEKGVPVWDDAVFKCTIPHEGRVRKVFRFLWAFEVLECSALDKKVCWGNYRGLSYHFVNLSFLFVFWG